MKIIELPIHFSYNGKNEVIYPTLIVQEERLILVDTGYPDFLPLIEAQIIAQGYAPEQLAAIIVTHVDVDHTGALHAFTQKYPQLEVYASLIEKPSIEGKEKSERLLQAERMLSTLPEEHKAFGLHFIKQNEDIMPAVVHHSLADGELILQGLCRVLHTPGHTAGHISLYFPELDTVIAGDAAVLENGELKVANPQFCLDLPAAEQSLHLLQTLGAKRYLCYHGGSLFQ